METGIAHHVMQPIVAIPYKGDHGRDIPRHFHELLDEDIQRLPRHAPGEDIEAQREPEGQHQGKKERHQQKGVALAAKSRAHLRGKWYWTLETTPRGLKVFPSPCPLHLGPGASELHGDGIHGAATVS